MLATPTSLWKASDAPASRSHLAEVVYRSNLLGADRSLANEGGGNTSVKGTAQDHTGRTRDVLFVKGSGSDLATVSESDFSILRLDWLLEAKNRDHMDDSTMVDYLLKSGMHYNQPRPSIETLVHAFIPAKHVDHTHTDAVIALTSSPNGRELAQEAFDGRAIWLDYVRPGYDLAKQIALALDEQPDALAILMAKHGLVTWADTSLGCYEATLQAALSAVSTLNSRAGDVLGGRALPSITRQAAEDLLAAALPPLRGAVSGFGRHMVVIADRSEAAVNFASSQRGPTLSQIGAACPDHLVNLKNRPLVPTFDPGTDDAQALTSSLTDGVKRFASEYQDYYDTNVDDETAQFGIDPQGPRVAVIPGIGVVTTGSNYRLARLSRDLFHRAIEVIGAADSAGGFTSLTDAEAFAVEYWPLERYKLTLRPPAGELEGRVAFITGAASGIGRAAARRLSAAGAHIFATDIDAERVLTTAREIENEHGEGCAVGHALDVTNEQAVKDAVRSVVLAYGGIDIVICSAGIATSSPFQETTLASWERNYDVLVKGYFLVARETYQVMVDQGIGGSIVFVGSKNAVVAGKSASAYSSAKAAELHLARCIAEEGGSFGIRVNTVNPDAVISGSSIWDSDWRKERADAHGVDVADLERVYRQRSVLKTNVAAEHVAEAIAFFASDRSSRTTGSFLNVDAGVTAAYPR